MKIRSCEIHNVKCFEHLKLDLLRKDKEPASWVTLLGENATGKSTLLQALALLVAGPDTARNLLQNPVGWVRSGNETGNVKISLLQGENDPGTFGETKISKIISYSFAITGEARSELDGEVYLTPSLVPDKGVRRLSWWREQIRTGQGWFAAGFGPFRKLPRSQEMVVPGLEPPSREAGFATLFDRSEELATLERWLVFLDYQIAKNEGNGKSRRRFEIATAAVNRLLPPGTRFDSVTDQGRVLFDVAGCKVSTLQLSDGFRSILALAGDLIWRLLESFPESEDPLGEEGVVLIDELDIHLHPTWQRIIAARLRELFPRIQFVVATHSPFIAAGAGEDALTFKLSREATSDRVIVEKVEGLAAMDVDRILESPAFGLISTYSPETTVKIERYQELIAKPKRSKAEEKELEGLRAFMAEARPIGGPPEPGSLQDRIEKYLAKVL